MEWVLYRIGIFLSNIFSRRRSYGIASFLGLLQFWFSFSDRRAVLENMRVILKDKSKEEIHRKAQQVFVNFAKYLVDFFRLKHLNLDFVKRYVEIRNREILDSLMVKTGIIIVTAHIGNWELGGAVAALLGYPLYAIALPHKNKNVNLFFDEQRKHFGVGIIPVGVAVRRCFSLLKKKKMVAFLGDRDFLGGGIEVEFLGEKAYLPLGAAVFSYRTLAPIVPSFFIRKKDDSFFLVFEDPIYPVDKEGRLRSEYEIMRNYLRVIEKYIRKYPEQWYMFQPFWKKV